MCVYMCVCIYIYIYIYTHTMDYYSAIRKQGNNAVCSNMDGPRDYHIN